MTFLSIMLLSGLLYVYRFRGIEKSLNKLIYYDYRGYNCDIVKKPEYYFLKPQGTPAEPPITIENRSITHNSNKTSSPEKEQGVILQLRENKDPITTERENININNVDNEDARVTKSDIIAVTKELITIPDYEELSPNELLKLDKRSTLTYLKDLMILDHTILSLVFRKSLKEPLFIRVLQMVFSFSMQFAINAMLYTDDVIDQRQSKLANVSM
jgi:hypothetical protein